jgi:DNA invertase Pin-like site-specific DNA recombinase
VPNNNNGKPKLAVLYSRFSPRPNAAECESCETQLAELRAWCQANGYEIAAEFSDHALSGGDGWEERPGMLDAVSTCRRGMAFLVRSYDRLFRDTDKALAFRSMLEAKGVDVRSITEEGANGDSMNAKLIRFIFLWLAEYQREIIRARTKARMLQHQAGGRRMSDRTPWGTRVDPSDHARLIANEEEIATATVIVARKQDGKSFRAIARYLQDAGILRRGKSSWSHVLVRRIYERFKGTLNE